MRRAGRPIFIIKILLFCEYSALEFGDFIAGEGGRKRLIASFL
jgi:hypothetical protein